MRKTHRAVSSFKLPKTWGYIDISRLEKEPVVQFFKQLLEGTLEQSISVSKNAGRRGRTRTVTTRAGTREHGPLAAQPVSSPVPANLT
jgi:hypothetical protein